MAISWYSISISTLSTGRVIFNGYLKVDNNTNLVTAFYETINGSTDFNNNIFANNTYNDADNIFKNNNFSFNGTNINYMNYYSNPSSPDYDATYNFFKLFVDEIEWIVFLNENGDVNTTVESTFIIQSISDPSCFNEGTKILCLNKNLEEEYIPVENLRKGDLVKTYKHGYRRIDLIGKNPMINNPEIVNYCMFEMKKTDDNRLIENLIVTGGHSILVDDLGEHKEQNDKLFGSSTQMIDDKYLLLSAVSKEFIRLENTDLYTYYHFILENNGDDNERFGIWANGILTETPSKRQFTNHKYTLL